MSLFVDDEDLFDPDDDDELFEEQEWEDNSEDFDPGFYRDEDWDY